VELGCRLLPAAWGTGLALEGGERLLDHAFDALRLQRVWALCHPQHDSVRYCVYTLGFCDRGVRPLDGVDTRHFVITRQAWQERRRQPRRERLRRALAQLKAERAPATEASR
jgi:RimJ/RimL family protein N-acetyltransferase